MNGKVVAIFGGSGFVGRHLVGRLAERGAVLRIATRNPSSAVHLKPMGQVGQIVPMEVDLGSETAVAAFLHGADYAVNLIGILHESRQGDFMRLQGRLPGRIGRHAAGLAGVVQISAIGADPSSPSLYARSKAAGERAMRESCPAAVIFRPSIIFGPEDSFFNRFAALSRFAPALPLIGGGTTRFQPVYVGNVADAIVLGLERPDLAGRVFELGGPKIYTFKQLLRYMLEVLGRPRLLVDLPWGFAELQARLLELLPNPPLTRDQIALLRRDNVVAADVAGFAELGLAPTPLEMIVPRYLRPSVRHGFQMPAR